MATNKKITELTELSEVDLADDDMLAIVDVSAGTTNKVRKSTLASALSGVSSITATTPIAVDQSTGAVVVSTGTIPITKGGTGATSAIAALAALGGFSDPTDTRGDIITRGASAIGKLGVGTSTHVLRSDGTDPLWGLVATSELSGNIDLTSQVTGTLPIASGGTGATAAAAALTALGGVAGPASATDNAVALFDATTGKLLQNSTVTISDAGAVAVTGGITGVTGLNGSQLGGRRNILYNGAMNVAQRSTSVAGLGATSSAYQTLDRLQVSTGATDGRYTMAQIADGPAGFANCLKLSCTTADTSIAAGEYFLMSQNLEGQDLQHIKKGTASAEELTLSFWVKGNASATYVAELFDSDNNRQISKTFAVTTSWAKITLTYPADTTGAFTDDNAKSMQFNVWFHAGSTYGGGTLNSSAWAANTNANRAVGISSFFDATSRTFFMTGVQMEIGPTATEFEYITYGEELALCQRYYESMSVLVSGVVWTNDENSNSWTVKKRATPTLVTTPAAGANAVFSALDSTVIYQSTANNTYTSGVVAGAAEI